MKNKFLKIIVIRSITIGIIFLFISSSIAQISNEKSLGTILPKKLSRAPYTFNPADDSYVSTTNPNQNNNNLDYMAIRNIGSGQWMCAGVIKFNITSIPTNVIVKSATLGLFYYSWMDNNPAGRLLSLRCFQKNWNEETITNNNMPSFNSEVSATSYVPSLTGVWMTVDVTTDVRKFLGGTAPNYGWIIKDDQYWQGEYIPCARFYVKEHGNYIPYLEVNVTELQSAVLFGRVTNLMSYNDYYTFDATRLRYIQFSPFSFNIYQSGETIAVTKQIGILTTNFAFGLFKAALL